MRWFRISLLLAVLTMVGCGAPSTSTPPPAAATTEIGATTAPTTPPATATEPAAAATEAPTIVAAEPTVAVTEAPTTAPAEATMAATEAPTTAPAEPTAVATEAPTAAPIVTAESTETAATPDTGSTATALWVQTGNRLVPVVVDRPRVIELGVEGEDPGATSAVIAPDGSRFAYGVNTPNRMGIAIFELANSQTTFIPDANFGARFSPDSSALVYTRADQTTSQLVVRDLQTGEERTVYEGTGQDVPQAIDWLPSGIVIQWLLVPSDAPPRRLGLLDPQSGELRTIREQGFLQAEVAPDGGRAAVVPGSWSMGSIGEAGLTIVDVGTGAEEVIVPQSAGQIMAVRWSPDSAMLAYSSITEWEAPARTLHLLSVDGGEGATIDVGELGTLQDIGWKDAATVLLLIADDSAMVRLYELPATATDTGEARELGVYDAPEQGLNGRILVARQ